MTREEILNQLSDCICEADENQLFGMGDKLFEIITELKEMWGIEE